MKTTPKNKPGIAKLRRFLKALVQHQFNPLQVHDPIRWRLSRPAILPPESPREKAANDLICLKWLADKIEATSK